MSETLQGLQEDAVDSLKDYIFCHLDYQELLDFVQEDQPHDIISEMADSGVPVYTADILEAAANSPELATEPSELRQDGTPLEIITDNIYCALQAAQHEWFQDNKDELEEECQAVVDAEEMFDEALEDEDEKRTARQIIEAIALTIDEYAISVVVDDGEELRVAIWHHLDKRHDKAMEKAKEKATSDTQS